MFIQSGIYWEWDIQRKYMDIYVCILWSKLNLKFSNMAVHKIPADQLENWLSAQIVTEILTFMTYILEQRCTERIMYLYDMLSQSYQF